MKNEKSESVQLTFCGVEVGGELTFVRAFEVVPEVGDEFVMNVSGGTYNADKGCLTIFDNETDIALVAYIEQHADAAFNGEPDAARFGTACVVGFEKSIDNWDHLVEVLRDMVGNGVVTLTITYHERQGRVWRVGYEM